LGSGFGGRVNIRHDKLPPGKYRQWQHSCGESKNFFRNFAVYLLPTIVFLSAFIMFIMLLFKKAIAVFPIYIAYVIFNVTPKAFENGDSLGVLSRAIIRLDGQLVNTQDVMLNRVIYLVLAAVLIFVACKLYDRLKNNLRKAVTI